MRTASQIAALLPELDGTIADTLEDQDLDFKQWDAKSRDQAVQTLVRMAVCMANASIRSSINPYECSNNCCNSIGEPMLSRIGPILATEPINGPIRK